MFTDVSHTVNDVLKHVKRQFGDEAAIQISDEDIIRWVNAGQLEIFRRSEPIKSSMVADTIANQGVYSFPGDVLKVQTLLVNGLPVKQLSSQEAEQYILDEDPARTATGQGQGCSVLGMVWSYRGCGTLLRRLLLEGNGY